LEAPDGYFAGTVNWWRGAESNCRHYVAYHAVARTAFRRGGRFEYDEKAPETHRTVIAVPNAALGARRALEAARRAYPNRRWQSVVIVLEVEPEPAASAVA
jgi:hypothetical protein